MKLTNLLLHCHQEHNDFHTYYLCRYHIIRILKIHTKHNNNMLYGI